MFTGQHVVVTGTSPWLAFEVEHLAAITQHVTVASAARSDGSRLLARLAKLSNVDVVRGRVVGLRGEAGLEAVLIEDRSEDVHEIAARAIFLCDDTVATVPDLLPGGVVDKQTGAILTVDGVNTVLPGLFAAGDVRVDSTPYLLCAAADGLRASSAADVFLAGSA